MSKIKDYLSRVDWRTVFTVGSVIGVISTIFLVIPEIKSLFSKDVTNE